MKTPRAIWVIYKKSSSLNRFYLTPPGQIYFLLRWITSNKGQDVGLYLQHGERVIYTMRTRSGVATNSARVVLRARVVSALCVMSYNYMSMYIH